MTVRKMVFGTESGQKDKMLSHAYKKSHIQYTKDLNNLGYFSKVSNNNDIILDNLHISIQDRLSRYTRNKERLKLKYIKALEIGNHQVNFEYLEK